MNLEPLGQSDLHPTEKDLDGGARIINTPLSRFERAQSGVLFAWRECEKCGKVFHKNADHEC